MANSPLDRGSQAEAQAERFLQGQGLVTVSRNFRSRYGEIDLIMREGDVLVFVEVRLRASAAFGGAASSIGGGKQQKILRTAQTYLAGLQPTPPCRFDALLLQGTDGARVEWIRNAFTA